MNMLSITAVKDTPKLLHGTIEATIFNASPYSPLFPFNVSSTNTCIYTNVISVMYIYIVCIQAQKILLGIQV